MHRRSFIIARFVIALLLALVSSGCGQTQTVASQAQQSDEPPQLPAHPTLADLAPPPRAGQPPPEAVIPVPAVIDLSLFQFTAPVGMISQNKKFWKRIDETGAQAGPGEASELVVDIATHDLLYKNGLRVGEGSVADWPQFKEIFDATGVTSLAHHFIAATATNQEFGASDEMPDQTLFYFDRHGLSGCVYDQCVDLFALSYQPAPQQSGVVRLELSPLVRAARKHLSYTVLNDEESVDLVRDEHLYDLGLRVDLPPGKFLVVAPSEQSERSMTIGHQFLTRAAEAGRREIIFIFVANTPPVAHVAQQNAVPK